MNPHFYLGTHHPQWLGTAGVPLMLSHRRLRDRKSFPHAIEGWALDSGGFSELTLNGKWTITPLDYVKAVKVYDNEIGHLEWAAPQDWMCEPHILTLTGLTVSEHQYRTVRSFLELRDLWGESSPFMPVLQGWTLDDYMRCIDLYQAANVDLENEPLVGVGSVCRRQGTGEIGQIFRSIVQRTNLKLHGFGVKTTGWLEYGRYLTSADSMAWSFNARRNPPLSGCNHKACNNCLRYALQWRTNLLRRSISQQMDLFAAEEDRYRWGINA